jgi:hypothetical protein
MGSELEMDLGSIGIAGFRRDLALFDRPAAVIFDIFH